MIINVFDQQESLKISLDQLKPLVEQVLREEERQCDEVSLYFVDTPTICDLHLQFFNDGSSTDCISFPMDDEDEDAPYCILGEVFVCPETALNYARSHHLDPYEETTLYIVHGLLHLMGYDDIEEEDLVHMRQAEERHMKQLKALGLCLTERP
ncbi:rRNA maturation RNase YbeY [Candidatus Protochlamydia phocaeensis]|uniref:rRNA maturation RNase YbeY n=1 Tax=Candidatus Protochlamydia phocaeensis TaxID=1414722 RepID=UPI000838959D|nr:rRNA maturation RNase YbeY [Candidatus Protochlamydia phocaeensis]